MPAEWFEKHKLVLFGVLLVTIIALQIAQLATGRSNSPAYVATLVQLGAESRSLARPGAAHSYKRVLNSHVTDKRTSPHPTWRSTVLLLPQRYNPGFTEPKFLRRTGIETVIVAGGSDGGPVVVPARALGRGAARGALGVRSEAGPVVAFTWDGETYTVDFPE